MFHIKERKSKNTNQCQNTDCQCSSTASEPVRLTVDGRPFLTSGNISRTHAYQPHCILTWQATENLHHWSGV